MKQSKALDEGGQSNPLVQHRGPTQIPDHSCCFAEIPKLDPVVTKIHTFRLTLPTGSCFPLPPPFLTSTMVADPYKALGLTHAATQQDIKSAYRKAALQLHPDRLTRQNASAGEMQQATTEFAKVASAYALLTDFARKRQYDHIYKYGGYDSDDPIRDGPPITPSTNTTSPGANRGTKRQQQHGSYTSTASSPSCSDPSQKKSARGIGYACTDHLAYILSQGRRTSTSVAGIQIPSRLHMSRPPTGAGGFRLSFSSGQFTTTETGTKRYSSKTTQFVAGKKFTRVETTVVHPDGRKEILIEGDDYVERRTTPPTRSIPSNGGENVAQPHEGDLPWYMEAWHGIKDKLSACYTPCIPVQ